MTAQLDRTRHTAALLLLCLASGCMVLSTFEVSSGQLTHFKAAGGVAPVAGTPVPLSAAQRQTIQTWFAAHRSGWSARYAPTLTPDWCLRLDSPQDKSVSLCRYGAAVVLRGLGPEVERALTADDEALFARAFERA